MLCAAVILAAAGGPRAFGLRTNTSIFSPASTPSSSIYSLSLFVLGLTLAIFVVVGGLILYAAVRFRQPADDDGVEPPQIFGSNQIELSWTIIPVLIVVVLFLATARIIFAIQDAPQPTSALEVTVIGHQYWWEFRYPTLHITTANELHIPVSTEKDPRPTFMKLTSADVIHSFWVPRLAGKEDVVPNRINELWMDAHTPGLYLGQCAQFCGIEHAKMLLRVYVDTPEQFAAWVKQEQQPGVQDPAVAAGRQEFETQACVNCHTIAGTPAHGQFGPDLTHLASRKTIASGAADNTTENLERWIDDPDLIKEGSLMPSMHLTSDQVHDITAYLNTLQ
ncbi:MAG TPA: cytochrome c oxidase subunit II [Acidobacteriaceae bacterium]|jgi:cytochrome c oxidase subunit 2